MPMFFLSSYHWNVYLLPDFHVFSNMAHAWVVEVKKKKCTLRIYNLDYRMKHIVLFHLVHNEMSHTEIKGKRIWIKGDCIGESRLTREAKIWLWTWEILNLSLREQHFSRLKE